MRQQQRRSKSNSRNIKILNVGFIQTFRDGGNWCIVRLASADDNVVDGNVNKLNEEADEAHKCEADRGRECNFLIL